MRVVNGRAASASWRAVFLADTGASAAANDNATLVEFIVRTDDGSTVSVVQANESGFRSGDRVIIVHDGNTRLTRPG